MKRIQTNAELIGTLKTLPLEHQHCLAKRFIASVIHLTSNPRLLRLVELLDKPECSEEDARTAHAIAQSVYVETGPGSDIAELKFDCQATHFIAQAVLACSAAYGKTPPPLLAYKVANYCRMAQTCAGMSKGEEAPDFTEAETEYNRIVGEQIDILNDYLGAE
ncbi:MAG: hypothetical protein AB1831_05990 [Pseudomonadota bacterium]